MATWEELARQEVTTLETEPYFPTKDNVGFFEVFGRGLVRGFLNVGKGIVGTVEEGLELLPGIDEENYLTKVRSNIETVDKKLAVIPDSTLEWGANILGQALPYMGSALIGGMYVKGGAAAIAFAVEGQDAYDAAKARGASENEANIERGIVGTLNAAIESWQIGRIMGLGKEGKMTMKAFKELAKQKAYTKMLQEGGRFTGKLLLNSVEEAVEEAVQEGVSITAPYLMEGREALPLREDGTVDTGAILRRVGEAGLAGAVISPFLGTAKAFFPAMAAPSAENYKVMRDSIQNTADKSVEWKEARLRDFDIQVERVTGESLRPIGPLTEYQSMLDNFAVKVAETGAKFRPEHEKTVSEITGAKKAEAAQYIKDNNHLVDEGKITRKELFATAAIIMQGSRTPEFNVEMTNDMYQQIQDGIRRTIDPESFDWDMANSFINKLMLEHKLPEKSEIKIMEPILGKDIVNKFLGIAEKKRKSGLTAGQKIVEGMVEFLNIPRATLASWDVSFAGRQGIMAVFKEPKLWAKSVSSAWRAYLSPEYATFLDMNLRNDPRFDFSTKVMKVKYKEAGTSDTVEMFASRLARKIPGVRASERAWVAAANHLRLKWAYKIIDQWQGKGRSKKDFHEMGQIINHLTGEGNIKALKKYKHLLNIVFFAPAWTQAGIQKWTDFNVVEIIKDRKISPAKKVLAQTLITGVGTGLAVLYLLSLIKGVDVEPDPRSTEFGKIKIGDTRFDFFGNDTRIARLVAQLIYGKRKTQGGDFSDAERMDVIVKWLQTKLSPAAGLAVDLYSGEDFKGKILEPTLETGVEQTLERSVPLFIQDLYDAIKYNGYDMTSGLVAVSAFHGVGVLTYPETKASQSKQFKNGKAQQYYGAKWDELGPMAQDLLKLNEPMIQEMDLMANQEKNDRRVNTRFLKEQRKSEMKLFRSLPMEMQDELNKLLVDIGGLSRVISGDWYLNDQRYLEYQSQVSKLVKETLPIYLDMDIDPLYKRMFIESAIDNIKEQVRQEIVFNATMKDLEKI
jgi:hypothetical protein